LRSFGALLVGFILALACPALTNAQASAFAGKWVNVDPATRGIVSLSITVSGERVQVEGKGKCHPKDCDLPPTEATAYSPVDRAADVLSYTTVWRVDAAKGKGFTKLFVLRFLSVADGELLEAQVLTRFDDGTRRPPTHETYILRRESK
jgi:hypothetical protein